LSTTNSARCNPRGSRALEEPPQLVFWIWQAIEKHVEVRRTPKQHLEVKRAYSNISKRNIILRYLRWTKKKWPSSQGSWRDWSQHLSNIIAVTPLAPEKLQIDGQSQTRPISQVPLVAEVKCIYIGLVMVEERCNQVDQKQMSLARDADPGTQLKLNNEQWQALISLHGTLLHEHHDFLLDSQHPLPVPPCVGWQPNTLCQQDCGGTGFIRFLSFSETVFQILWITSWHSFTSPTA
jgi:hypothetical protein